MSIELLEAVRNGNLAAAAELLGSGAERDFRAESGHTPLMVAARSGNVGMVRLLIESGADVHLEDDRGWTALFMGCHDPEADRGYPDVVEALIRAGSDIEKPIGYGITPLMLAAGYGEAGVVEILLEAGAKVKAVNEGGRTARQMATDKHYIEVVNLLWEAEMTLGEDRACSSGPATVKFFRQ